jgi:DNA repair exonuclease SbcCD nuclease subunit
MNYLFFGDLHIQEKSIEECNLVMDEIFSIAKQYKVDLIFNAGDSFNKVNPSALEQNCFSQMVKDSPVKMVTIVAESHESISDINTSLSHYNILCPEKIELHKFWTDNNIAVGHFAVKESKLGYGAKVSITELRNKYKETFLGHVHIPEDFGNVHQLGSVRFVSHNETGFEIPNKKRIAIITNYGTKNQKLEFIPLSSPYPMKTLTFVAGVTFPDWKKENPLTKTRYIFKDLDSYKNFIPFEQEVKNYFTMFKVEFDLTKKDYIANEEKKESITLEQSFKEFCVKNKVDNRIANIINRAITTSGENNEVKS